MKKASPSPNVMKVVDDLLKENPDAQAAFKAIRARGGTEQWAKEEIARALLGALWEAWNKKAPPNRIQEVMRSLESGKTTVEVFPH